EQRPVRPVDSDDLLRLDPVPQRQPPALARHLGQDRRSAAADPRCGGSPGMRSDGRLDMRHPVPRIGAGGVVDRRPCMPWAARRIGEEQRAERPRLRPILAADEAFEDQHVFVLVIEYDAFELPVECVVGAVERGRMPLGADRASGHQPAPVHSADPRILNAVALPGSGGGDRLVIMQCDDLKPIRAQLDGQQPGERGERHDLPAVTVKQKLARVGRVAQFERPAVEHIAALRVPAEPLPRTVEARLAKRFRDPHHHQEVAVGQPRETRIEYAEHISLAAERPCQRRTCKIDIVGRQDQPVLGKTHSSAIRCVTASWFTTARRGCVSMKCTATAISSARSIFSALIISRCFSAGISGYWKSAPVSPGSTSPTLMPFLPSSLWSASAKPWMPFFMPAYIDDPPLRLCALIEPIRTRSPLSCMCAAALCTLMT